MKMHKTLFLIGLLVFITPFLGLPSFIEMILVGILGIVIMAITAIFHFTEEAGKRWFETEDRDVFAETKPEHQEYVTENSMIGDYQEEASNLGQDEEKAE